MLGPVFAREALTTPRRPRHYAYRAVYPLSLLLLMCTAWLILAGTQVIRNVGDIARFGAVLFSILAPLQLALLTFFAALGSASSVCQEKDRRTIILLLLTRMSNFQLVVGKLMASLLTVLVMLAAALPVFMMTTLFGGVSFEQVARTFGVTLATLLAAGSLGSTIALQREKTFQALSMTALVIVIWLGLGEVLHAGALGRYWGGWSTEELAVALSPFRAILSAARPTVSQSSQEFAQPVIAYIGMALAGSVALNLLAIRYVRIWNPSREVRPGQGQAEGSSSIWGAEHEETSDLEQARQTHVDARVRAASGNSRRVWDNPILWREVRTWAYGKKVILIRMVYVALVVAAFAGAHWAITRSQELALSGDNTIIPYMAQILAPLFFVSLVIVNALAVNAITNERDGQAIDLLLVTDLTPREFILGKLGGVIWVAKEMIVLPLVLCVYVWSQAGMNLENLILLSTGLVIMDLFVAVLGLHCGLTYANSRSAISVSLGTVFFLFLGVITCMVMMVSFSGNFQNQLAPFLAFILGGSVGLYISLGIRNPSQAIGVSSLILPFATFFAITSFLLRNQELTVFIVTVFAYGFTTLAMLIPAIYEFDIAMGRTKTAGDDE